MKTLSMRLKDKVALITGSSRGIGRAMALTFAREGANIVVNYNSNQEAGMETFQKVKAMGRNAILEKADVSSQVEVDRMVKNALSTFGRVDILVNNAGIVYHGPSTESLAERLSEDLWPSMMAINLYGPMNCIRAVAQPMVDKKYGKIINISSLGGLVTSAPVHPAYVASKSAILALTKRLAEMFGPYGINVNCIAPGPTMTDLLKVGRTDEDMVIYQKTQTPKIVLGRLGQPEYVADAALFLASDESSYITGHILNVDGGRIDLFSHS